jgi:hypothetical protein
LRDVARARRSYRFQRIVIDAFRGISMNEIVLKSIVPILFVRDVSASAAFFRDELDSRSSSDLHQIEAASAD